MTSEQPDMTYRTFVLIGRVYSGSEDHAKHSVFWAIRNSEYDSDILIDKLIIPNGETNE